MLNSTTQQFVATGIPLNIDGTFNTSRLQEQKKYRVKIFGNVTSGKATQPIYIDLIYEIPPPQIFDVIFPPQIIKAQAVNITVPIKSVKCSDGCSSITISCRSAAGACPASIPMNTT